MVFCKLYNQMAHLPAKHMFTVSENINHTLYISQISILQKCRLGNALHPHRFVPEHFLFHTGRCISRGYFHSCHAAWVILLNQMPEIVKAKLNRIHTFILYSYRKWSASYRPSITALCISRKKKHILCTKWSNFTMLFCNIKVTAHSSP